jgi:hypothetical protein
MGQQQHYEEWSIDASCAFDIVHGEFVVATADGADVQAYRPLCAVLDRVRRAFGIDAAFIAQWAGGAPVVHRTDAEEEEDVQAGLVSLQATYGRRLLEESSGGRGGSDSAVRFEAVPIITDGMEYGILCGRRILSDAAASEPPALRSVARLISRWFEEADLSLSGLMPLRGDSVMGALPMTMY